MKPAILFYLIFTQLLLCEYDTDVQTLAPEGKTLPLRLAAFDVDVTPQVGERLAWDPVINTWDMGLRAKGIVLLGAGKPVVIIAIDWLGIANDVYDQFKYTLAEAAGTIPERVAVHSLHNHDSPEAKSENDFTRKILHRLQGAIKNTLDAAQPVTHIGTGEAEVYKVASNRRILRFLNTKNDSAQKGNLSEIHDSLLQAKEVFDPMISLISFWNESEPLTILSFYATHPISYYRTRIPNPDFAGIARFYRQLAVPDALHIHFTGAAGNVSAVKYNEGKPHENRGIFAERLADGMKRAWEATEIQPISPNFVGWNVVPVVLPADTTKNNAYVERYKKGTKIDLQCLTLNNARLLFMPGELFVQYQLAAKDMCPDLFVTMAAYGDYSPGYIPTADAFLQHDFEVRASKVTPKAEDILIRAIGKLLGTENLK